MLLEMVVARMILSLTMRLLLMNQMRILLTAVMLVVKVVIPLPVAAFELVLVMVVCPRGGERGKMTAPRLRRGEGGKMAAPRLGSTDEGMTSTTSKVR